MAGTVDIENRLAGSGNGHGGRDRLAFLEAHRDSKCDARNVPQSFVAVMAAAGVECVKQAIALVGMVVVVTSATMGCATLQRGACAVVPELPFCESGPGSPDKPPE